jgi:hypothetical protein
MFCFNSTNILHKAQSVWYTQQTRTFNIDEASLKVVLNIKSWTLHLPKLQYCTWHRNFNAALSTETSFNTALSTEASILHVTWKFQYYAHYIGFEVKYNIETSNATLNTSFTTQYSHCIKKQIQNKLSKSVSNKKFKCKHVLSLNIMYSTYSKLPSQNRIKHVADDTRKYATHSMIVWNLIETQTRYVKTKII